MLEALVGPGRLARETKRVRLGTLVTGVTYRNPAMLAKMATTLDVISGGRAMLGLGAAWNEVEHAGYGYDFPPVGERMDRLDEALTIIRAMFTRGAAVFDGPHYRIEEALNVPRPIQPGGPRDHGRRRWRAADAEDRGETRRHDPLVPARPRRAEAQDGGPRRLLRGDRRDPATIERTMAAPVIVPRPSRGATAALERVPPERRPFVDVGPPEQMADALRPTSTPASPGFTFNNTIYRTPEAIAPRRRTAPAHRRVARDQASSTTAFMATSQTPPRGLQPLAGLGVGELLVRHADDGLAGTLVHDRHDDARRRVGPVEPPS